MGPVISRTKGRTPSPTTMGGALGPKVWPGHGLPQGCGVGVGVGRSRQFWPESESESTVLAGVGVGVDNFSRPESESESTKFYRPRLRPCSRKIASHHAKLLSSEGKMAFIPKIQNGQTTKSTYDFDKSFLFLPKFTNLHWFGEPKGPNRCFPELIGRSRSRSRSGVGVDFVRPDRSRSGVGVDFVRPESESESESAKVGSTPQPWTYDLGQILDTPMASLHHALLGS